MGRNLLLEMGVEEMPSSAAMSAISQLNEIVDDILADRRLSFDRRIGTGTPRRLVLSIQNLAETQEDIVEEVKGPPRKVAFNLKHPTAAATGFASSQGVKVADLLIKGTPQGEYVYAVKRVKGTKTERLLPELLAEVVDGLRFARSMRWDGELRFIRPIRWLLALYGNKVVDFDLDGLKGGDETFGHRFLAPGPFRIRSADWSEYKRTMSGAKVVVEWEAREKAVLEKARAVAADVKGKAVLRPKVLSEVVFLVEYPSVLLGSFSKEFLTLPREVLEVTMEHHQRYFPVENSRGRLLPHYVIVHNGAPRQKEIILRGHNRVIAARLADARFFYEEDQKIPLAKRVKDLEGMVFQEGLGTIFDKAKRLQKLSGKISRELKVALGVKKEAERAALLCKADLTTEMVGEFPELQGVIGREYARISGESSAVSEAICEHYLPRGAQEEPPASDVGRIVSIADKVDTLAGTFSAGRIPTGSEDPYGLRRQAQGLVSILLDAKWRLSLKSITAKAFDLYQGLRTRKKPEIDGARHNLEEFLGARVRAAMQNKGLAPDLVEAVLSSGLDDPFDAVERGYALRAARESSLLEDIQVAFNRCFNLGRTEHGAKVSERFLEDAAERALLNEVVKAEGKVSAKLKRHDYPGALVVLASLKKPVDLFFDEVLVMAENERLRKNRLALLNRVVVLFGSLADFSRLMNRQT